KTYEKLLVDNVSTVSSIESSLRTLTWLLPGRFEDAEVASEGLYALLSLVTSYHDTLLQRRIDPSLSLPPHPFQPESTPPSEHVNPESTSGDSTILPTPSEHARYTRYWTKKSGIYRRASRALTTISYVELLVEMVAKKKGGDKIRWRLVVWMESLKTILRLIILIITKRPVLSPATPQREYDPSSLPQSAFSSSSSPSSSTSSSIQNTFPSYDYPSPPLRTHLYPLSSALPETYLPHPTTLLPELDSTSEVISEVLSISSTLVHVILLLRSAKKPHASVYRPFSLPTLSRNLSPFLIPIILQLLSRSLRSSRSSILLADHYAQQDRQLAKRFFLSGPMWVGWTRPKILGVVRTLERIPVVGLVGEFVEAYLPLVDDYLY
ncbi:hypothetical protein TREMEDRAFT_16146, partial [Tremella mesenterica DSM 1558]